MTVIWLFAERFEGLGVVKPQADRRHVKHAMKMRMNLWLWVEWNIMRLAESEGLNYTLR